MSPDKDDSVRVERARLYMREECVAAIAAYAEETHRHVGVESCQPESGDRCDITAALRVAARRVGEVEL